jgi:hypothetical protein
MPNDAKTNPSFQPRHCHRLSYLPLTYQASRHVAGRAITRLSENRDGSASVMNKSRTELIRGTVRRSRQAKLRRHHQRRFSPRLASLVPPGSLSDGCRLLHDESITVQSTSLGTTSTSTTGAEEFLSGGAIMFCRLNGTPYNVSRPNRTTIALWCHPRCRPSKQNINHARRINLCVLPRIILCCASCQLIILGKASLGEPMGEWRHFKMAPEPVLLLKIVSVR